MRAPTDRPRARRAPHRWRLRTLLLSGMLLPLVGLTAAAGAMVQDRDETRQASVALEASAADLASEAQFLSALGLEEVHSNVLGLATTYEALGTPIDIDLAMTRARLAGARAVVDSERFRDIRTAIGIVGGLHHLRDRLDRGTADYDDVRSFFTTTDAAIEDGWGAAMDEVDGHADREALSAELRRRVRGLRSTMAAFAMSDDRVAHALALFLEAPTPERSLQLITAGVRFDASVEEARDVGGPALAAAWSQWSADPAAQRTEAMMDLAARIGSGLEPPVPSVDPVLLAQGLEDGARWGVLLTDSVRAAAVDLEESASAHAESAGRDMSIQMGATAALVFASLVAAGLIARSITRPVRRLEGAVRQVEAGQFRLAPLPDRGPQELAATARAFNEMSATLAAVEGHAVALATDPASPVLEDKLPGRTGEAMQAALDRLRASIADAESQRAELAERASHDALTGLLNRAAVLDALQRDLARGRRDGSAVLVLYVDLDGLKEINDTHGHSAGDDAIRRTADALREATRDGDVVARLGGDEFLVVGPLLPGGRADADALTDRIREAVAARATQVPGGEHVSLRCSIGAAVSDPATSTADDLVRTADAALYRAKRDGRDRVAWSSGPTGRVGEPV